MYSVGGILAAPYKDVMNPFCFKIIAEKPSLTLKIFDI
jgi:hypothetical protein